MQVEGSSALTLTFPTRLLGLNSSMLANLCLNGPYSLVFIILMKNAQCLWVALSGGTYWEEVIKVN